MGRPSSAALLSIFLSGFVFSASAQTVTASPPSSANSTNWWNTALVAADCPPNLASTTQRIHPDVCLEADPSLALPAGAHATTNVNGEYQESWNTDVSSMPQCIAKDLTGNLVTYWWGSETNTAYAMDPLCPPWLGIVESRIDKFIGGEGIYQDNISDFLSRNGPFSDWDRTGFIAYLKARVAAGQITGLPSAPDNIDIAQYISSKGYGNGNPAALDDLVFHEFVRYRYLSSLNVWAGIVQRTTASAAASGNTALLLNGNQGGMWLPTEYWVYAALLSQYQNAIQIENFGVDNSPLPQYHDSLIYKLGLASGYSEKPVWIWGGLFDGATGQLHLPNYWRLAIAEAYSNGGVHVIHEQYGTQDQPNLAVPDATLNSAVDYASWLNSSRDWMTGKRSLATVAVVYSIPTLLWREFPATNHHNGAQAGALNGFARALEDSHIPFDSVFFGHPDFWDDSRLAAAIQQYKVLILPAVDCLSDSQIQILKAYLAAGGSIVATGSLGGRDENYAVRSRPASASFAGNSNFVLLSGSPDLNYFDTVSNKGETDSADLATLSKPVLQYLGSEAQIATNAPATVSFNVFGSPDGTDLYVHLLNYDLDVKTDTVRSASNVQVGVKVPAGFDSQNKTLWITSPELGQPVPTAFTVSGGIVRFTLSSVTSHVIAAFCDRNAQLAARLAQAGAQPVLLYGYAASMLTALDSASQALNAGQFNAAAGFLDSLRSAAASAASTRLYVDESHDEALTIDPQQAAALDPQNPQFVLLDVLTSTGAIADRQTTGPITYANLTNYDALVIAQPQDPLSGGEIVAVQRFVRAGGALILIGNGNMDGASMNSIAAAFGLRFLGPALCSNPNLWDPGSFDVAYIAPNHPVTAGLSELNYNWGTGLLTDSRWQPLIETGPQAWLDSNGSICQVHAAAQRPGPFIHTAVRTFGGGRVIAVGDDPAFWTISGEDDPALGRNVVAWAGAAIGPRRSVIQSAGADIEAAAAAGRSAGLSDARADLAAASAAVSNNNFLSARSSALKASSEAQSAVAGTAATPPSLCCLQNAGDYGPDGGGGVWMSLLGQGLSATARSWTASDFENGQPPTVLDGVSVTVNGVPGSVAYISPGQVNFLVPDGVAGAAQIEITAPAGKSQLTVDTAAVSPALFCYSAASNRWVAAIHTDGVLVSRSGLVSGTAYRPAAPGETISLYGTGFGLSAAWASGASTASPVVVQINGVQAQVTFAGLVSPGVYQVNITVPDLQDGDLAVEVAVTGQAAISDALLPVQR